MLQGTTDEKKSDIWALGITAIQLAEGYPPYRSLFPARVLCLHLIYLFVGKDTDRLS
mgnify:CR=1 FL=1